MKKSLQKLLAVSVLGAAGLTIATGALADTTTTAVHPTPMMKKHMCMRMHRMHGWHHHSRLGLYHHKNLNAEDAAIITKAALLERGFSNLTIGDVKPTMTRHHKKAYLVSIVNSDKKVVRQIILNSATGHFHPVHMKSA